MGRKRCAAWLFLSESLCQCCFDTHGRCANVGNESNVCAQVSSCIAALLLLVGIGECSAQSLDVYSGTYEVVLGARRACVALCLACHGARVAHLHCYPTISLTAWPPTSLYPPIFVIASHRTSFSCQPCVSRTRATELQ